MIVLQIHVEMVVLAKMVSMITRVLAQLYITFKNTLERIVLKVSNTKFLLSLFALSNDHYLMRVKRVYSMLNYFDLVGGKSYFKEEGRKYLKKFPVHLFSKFGDRNSNVLKIRTSI